MRTHVSTITAGLCLTLFASFTVQAQVRTYEANFATVAPTIDGTIGDNEWSAAASGGGAWTLLRTPAGGDPDAENNRFRAMWNQDGFYIVGESDYGLWADDINGQFPAASDLATGDFFNVFLDPNLNEDENIGQKDFEIDQYQIGFNLHADARSCGGDGIAGTEDDCTQPPEGFKSGDTSVTGSSFGTLTAAHSGGLFDNNSEWAHLRKTHISYNNDADGGVFEMFIPWDEFDANETDFNERDTGLFHPFAPEENDIWLFNVTRISSDAANLLPTWNWTSSLFFASHGDGADDEGHGEIIFKPAPVVTCDPNSLGDLDGNGTVEFADFLTLSANFGNAVTSHSGGDIDCNGTVEFADFLVLSANFGSTVGGAQSVPEPSGLALLGVAGFVGGLMRRRRT